MGGHTYSVFECAYLRPWPNVAPWVARIEEILVRIGNNNKVKTFLGVRWFYRRADLLPSAVAEYPPCDDEAHEVYLFNGKLDELACDLLVRSRPRHVARSCSAAALGGRAQLLRLADASQPATQVGPCRVVSSCDVPDLATLLLEPDSFFYRYEYNPFQRDRHAPLFMLPGGAPIATAASERAPAR